MTETTYRKAKEIFLTVCDLETGIREERLQQACNGDPALLIEVRSLLEHHGAWSAPPGDSSQADTIRAEVPPGRLEPNRIGKFRIHHEIGRGGMGVVYAAEREGDRYHRLVAIKVLKRGMDTEEVLRRFELERQVLSAFNHPNIAQLYDVGETDDHRPYYVMEYIEGQPIDEYADAHRLTIEKRLGLFRSVCRAVHHAHRNLVVHRDLKPGNILVNRDGVPKLLDFGIAKIINPELSMIVVDPTAPEFRVMTPEYASPEQVRGKPITTASDVYSLGVLLFGLLTGHRPYQFTTRSRGEIERIVCDVDPERPSTAISLVEEVGDASGRPTRTITPDAVCKVRDTRLDRLRKRLAGDVDNIVLKAMHKVPERRYESAEQLGEDIDRHIDGLPVLARPDTWTYRASKFVRRNRLGVGAAAAVGLALVAGGTAAGMGWQNASEAWIGEQEQKESAQRRTAAILAMSHNLLFDYEEEIRHLDGALPAREVIVTMTRSYLSDLRDDVGDDPELLRLLAAGHDKMGSIEGGKRTENIGQTERALESYQTGLRMREDLLRADPDDPDRMHDAYLSNLHVGDVLIMLDRLDEAEAPYRRAEQLVRILAARDSTYARDEAVAMLAMGKLAYRARRHDEVLPYYERSLAIRKQLLESDPDDLQFMRDVSTAHSYVAGQLVRQGDLDRGLEHYLTSLELREERHRRRSPTGQTHRDVANMHLLIGQTLYDMGRYLDAASHLELTLDSATKRMAVNRDSSRARKDLSLAQEAIGKLAWKIGDRDRAREMLVLFSETAEGLVASSPGPVLHHRILARSHQWLGELAAEDDDRVESVRRFRRGLAVIDAIPESVGEDTSVAADRAWLLHRLGRELTLTGDRDDAITFLARSREIYKRLSVGDEPPTHILAGYADVLEASAQLSLRLGSNAAAVGYARRAVEEAPEVTPVLLGTLAEALRAAGETQEADEIDERRVRLEASLSAPG